jgi:murein DD-endopeptidase MepM/ murein hydrolase activator NlpD
MRLALALLVLVPPPQEPPRRPLHRSVDLALGESREVDLGEGRKATVRLLEVEETRESLCLAAWRSRVKVSVDGAEVRLTAGTYNLPVTVGPAQIDCPITRGPYQNAATDYWVLEKDARLRIWPAGSPLLEPGTFGYPLRQRWAAGDTWMSNEPVIVGAPKGKLYYHAGLDIGGSEALIDVVSATDGLVVVAGKEGLPGHENGVIPGYARERYTDQVFVLDDRGWYHGYVHLKTIDAKAGQKIRRGQKIGLLGKEGGSGGWSHLHYEIRALQPSGKWGTENGYPFIWEAYVREHQPPLLAVAGPLHHQLARVGQAVELDGSLSRSFAGQIAAHEWTLTDGRTVAGPAASRTYDRPGTYSEILKVVDSKGNVDYDFALIGVVDPAQELPPRLNATYAPTFGIRPGDAVTFKVRTWNTKVGEETWDFGDGSPRARTKSEGGYAETSHRYAKPGHYLVRVERADDRGIKGVTHLQVRVEERPAAEKGWRGWLDRRLLPPGEARSMMERFVERRLTPLPLPDSREAWLARREGLRREIFAILGIEDFMDSRPAPVVRPKGTIRREGYRIEKLTFETWPGLEVPALLYLPEGVKEPVPGMVSITGHTDVSKAADYLQQRNVNLALRGCAVLAYEYFGYGERRTGDHPHHPTGANGHGLRSFSFSRRTATGLEAIEAIRAIDVLAARPEVDRERIGFTGESGGSNSTYWAAALDPRVKLAVPVCSVTTFDYWIRTNVNWDWHQRPPGIRRVADIGTLLALHAPGPLLVLSSKRGTDDQEFPLDEAEKSHQWARHVYRLLGAEEAVAHVESTTAHGYQEDKRRHLYRWVERWLRPPAPKGDAELPAKVERIEELRCGLPEGNLTFRDVFAEWVKPLPRPGDPATHRSFLRERLGFPAAFPAVKAEKVGQEESAEFWIFEPEPGVRLPGILIGRSGPIVLLPGRNREAAARAIEAGRRVFAFDPRGTGEMEGYRGNTWGDVVSNWAWFEGRPWPGMWALDLLQAARFSVETLGAPSVSVDASGLFGWPALLAGAAAPEILPSGSARVAGSSLHEILRARGDGALADVPGLLERLDIPRIRELWTVKR